MLSAAFKRSILVSIRILSTPSSMEKIRGPKQSGVSIISDYIWTVSFVWRHWLETVLYIYFRAALAPHGYVKIRTIRLLGIVLSIFVLRNHLIHIKNMETQYTRLSLGGYLVSSFLQKPTGLKCILTYTALKMYLNLGLIWRLLFIIE